MYGSEWCGRTSSSNAVSELRRIFFSKIVTKTLIDESDSWRALDGSRRMKTIFCSLHGYTHWEPPLIELINTPEFQRLKRIKQLAAVHHVFPCAVHTRFEHSIGVGHLAERFARALLARQPGLQIDPLVLKLAGLCHDLGHGPLSHAYDKHLAARGRCKCAHEDRSVDLLRVLVRRYGIDLDAQVVDDACELIRPRKHTLPTYLYQIIANHVDGIDVDKFDYLSRDAMHTGMSVTIDFDRFLEYARVIDDRLCYPFKGMPHAINQLFLVRHQMHAQVYQHPVVRAFEHMYLDILSLLDDDDGGRLNHADITDDIFTRDYATLRVLQGHLSQPASVRVFALLDRIARRQLYRCIFETRISAAQVSHLVEKRASSSLLLFDIVKIGYAEHPLFSVAFFGADGVARRLSPEEASRAFAFHPHDCFVRIYTRDWKDPFPQAAAGVRPPRTQENIYTAHENEAVCDRPFARSHGQHAALRIVDHARHTDNI